MNGPQIGSFGMKIQKVFLSKLTGSWSTAALKPMDSFGIGENQMELFFFIES